MDNKGAMCYIGYRKGNHMKIKVSEILLTMEVAKELLRSNPDIVNKLEKLLAQEVCTLLEDNCMTVNQLSNHLCITPEQLQNLYHLAGKK